jgi:molecular chaperone DnaK
MASDRINYGIDLGTTNSAIARMEKGKPEIRKTDLNHDTMPSCVGWNRKGVLLVGDSPFNQLISDRLRSLMHWVMDNNIFIEFKRTMGTDKRYKPSALEQDFTSEELSAEVLKKLKSFVQDENIHAAVITVPAKFTVNQKDATARAAKLAGFEQFELLQEPVAACMAYGLGQEEKKGMWVVFDFGGGTFDAAVVKAEDGILKVIDTEGDNYLGGKNLDYAIVDEIIIPYLREQYALEDVLEDELKLGLLRDAMKRYAELAKIDLSFKQEHHILSQLGEIPLEDADGNEVELDLLMTRDQMAEVISPIYQRAIDLTAALLERNKLDRGSITSLILVGGPTYSPILREMIASQIREPDTRVDPMTVVAEGAALYASTIKAVAGIAEATRDRSKVQLDFGYESTSVQPMEFVSVKLLSGEKDLLVEIERADGTWASGRRKLDVKGDVFDVELSEGVVNSFLVKVYDTKGDHLACEPDSFNIIQGTQVSSAPLPQGIGIEVYQVESKRRVFVPVKGLTKNQPLPATGVANGVKTSVELRPGNAKDVLRIPLYEGDYDAAGTLAILNEHIYDAVITGADVSGLVPAGSQVDVTIVTDRGVGRPERVKVFFPHLNEEVEIQVQTNTVQKEVDADWLDRQLDQCEDELAELGEQEGVERSEIEAGEEELERLRERLNQNRNDYDAKKEVLEHLKKLLRQLDQLRMESSWPALQAEMKELYAKLVKANADLGNPQTTLVVQNLKERMDRASADKNVRVAKGVKDEMDHLFFKLTEIYQLMGVIQYYSENFRSIHWRDAVKANVLLERGRAVIASGPTVEQLLPICRELWALTPSDERPLNTGGLLTD